MNRDATFQDAREAPLNLGALEPEDLPVLSALAQDAVFPITQMVWRAGERRFAFLLNRFRWEDRSPVPGHAPERVQSLLVIDQVRHVASQGIDRRHKDTVLSLLSLEFQPGELPAGRLLLTLSGDGAIRLDVEALEVTLRDVTRPYGAPSGKRPTHRL